MPARGRTVDAGARRADHAPVILDERRAARGSLAAALIVLALASLSPFFAPVPCGGLPAGYAPIVALELARSQSDLDAIFGAEPSACRTTIVAAIDLTDWVDTFVFAPSYGVFLALFFASRARSGRAARLGIGLAVTAVAFDLLENACLLTLTGSLDARSSSAVLLPWMTGVKWLALGMAGLPEAWIFAREGGIASKVGAAFALLAPVGVALALVAPARFGAAIALAVTCAWVPCLVSVAIAARRPTTA